MYTILFLAADPTNMLRLDEEARAIDQSLRMAGLREQFQFAQHMSVRISDLQELLLRYKPYIVHFSGHGKPHSEIVLYNDKVKAQAIPVDALQSLFSTLSENIQCVVLNACYSKAQADAIAKEINYVIGMSDKISDDAARTFSIAFYRAIGYGETIKKAFEFGVNQIHLENLGEHDIPRLISLKSSLKEITLSNTDNQTNPNHTPLSDVQVEPISKKPSDSIGNVIADYVSTHPLLSDTEVVGQLSKIINSKINFASSIFPDDTTAVEITSIASGVFIRFMVEAHITEKYGFTAMVNQVLVNDTPPLDNRGIIRKEYPDRRIFFTLIVNDKGLAKAGYEKPDKNLDKLWSSWTQNEAFQELPFQIDQAVPTEIRRGFYEAIHQIATRGIENNEPHEFLKSMRNYGFEFPRGLRYQVGNHDFIGIFPSQFMVVVEAVPIYKISYKRLDARTKGLIFKEHYKVLVKGQIYLCGTTTLRKYNSHEGDVY